MNSKVLGAAVAAAMLGLSTASFGQGSSASPGGASGPSGQDTPREASRADSGAGSASGSSGAVTSGSGGTVVAPGATTGTASRCDTLTGAERTRCMRDERSSTGSSTPGVPVTGKPGDSGVGAVDKTHPGQEPAGTNAANPRDSGTSAAGGPGGK